MSPVRDTRCQIAARLFDTEKGNTRERKHLITTPLRLSQGYRQRYVYASATIPRDKAHEGLKYCRRLSRVFLHPSQRERNTK